jgi:DNA ligase-1
MLAGKCEDMSTVKFPVLASAKLDGIRALVIGGEVVSRQLKPIPNAWVQKQFGGLPEGTDGELIFGDPTHPDAYRNTVSAVMSEDGTPTEVHYHVFDNFLSPGGFAQRFRVVEHTRNLNTGVCVVAHSHISNAAELEAFEAEHVEAGHEGIMIRSLAGPYKQGRSTEKEGFLLKVKRFVDTEAVILDTYERLENTNEATKDALGHTVRSSHKDGKVGHGDLGGFDVAGLEGEYKDVQFSVGTGLQGAERISLWKIRDTLVGKIIKVKYFASGSKERPRFPVFLGFRDERDM